MRVDTVERMQGLEARLVIVCMGYADTSRVERELDFVFTRTVSRLRCHARRSGLL